MADRISVAFASSGDTASVPETDGTGNVNYTDGWPDNYSRAKTEVGYKFIDRTQHNQLWKTITGNVKEWQEQVSPIWYGNIDYPGRVTVRYSDGEFYISKSAGSAAGVLPTNTAFWQTAESFYEEYKSIFEYTVSQYAAGDSTRVAFIAAGVVVDNFDYFVFQGDGRMYSRNGATGTLAGVFDPDTGTDPGITGALKNIKSITRSDVFGLDQDWETAELTDTGATFADGTASYRVTGATYTNTHDKPLYISIYALASASSAVIRVDGVDRFTLASNITGTLTAIIPPLSDYQLINTITLIYWGENRPNGN